MVELFPAGFAEESRGEAVELVAFTDEAGVRRMEETFGEVGTAAVLSGWEDEWRRFHVPVLVGSLWVGPPWAEPAPGLTPVVIDPGRAFGTGGHATTRLCLELLHELERGSFVDVGCGSGVLAIAAAKLGFGPVVALDLDEAAVEAARRSVARALNCSPTAGCARQACAGGRYCARKPRPRDGHGPRAAARLPSCGHLGLLRERAGDAGRFPASRTALPRQLGGRPLRARVASPRRWLRSRFASSAARCRTQTRTQSARRSSATVTARAKGARSPSSTAAASPTRLFASRGTPQPVRPERTGGST